MKEITTYVGIDAHKKDLFVAMLIGHREDAGDVAAGRTSPMRCVAWCASSSEKPRVRYVRVTKPARAAMRCSVR